MTRIQTRIIELFEALPPEERAEMLDRLAAHGRPSIFDQMSEEQRAQLDLSIAEADRGEGESAWQVMAELAAKAGITRL